MAFQLKGLRWWIIGLIGLATIINYIDRSAINIMWPYIYKEFGIADADNKNALALITTCDDLLFDLQAEADPNSVFLFDCPLFLYCAIYIVGKILKENKKYCCYIK